MTSMVRGLLGALVLFGVALSASPGQAQYYYSPYQPPPPGYYVPAQPAPPPPRDLNRAYDPERDGPLGYPTQQRGPVLMGTTCYAGNYVCQVYPQPAGSGCACPAIGAPSYGVVR